MPFPQAVPRVPVLDTESCIWFERQVAGPARSSARPMRSTSIRKTRLIELNVGNIIMATGWKLFDCRKIPQYGYGRLANVYTSLEFERLCNAAGPTNGKIVLRDGKTEPKSVAIIHCVGSRDLNHNAHCSAVCCMASLKFGHLVMEKTDAEVYSFYIDMRTNQKDYEEFYQRLLDEGVHFVRGKVAEVTDAARSETERGKLIVQCEDTLMGRQQRYPGRHGHPDGRLGTAGRRQGTGSEVRHLLQHGRLLHRAASEARPGGHDDRRRVRGRHLPGRQRTFPPRWPRAPPPRPAWPGMITKGKVMIEPVVATIDEENCSGLPDLQQPLPLQRHRIRRGAGCEPRDHGLVQGLRHLRGRLSGRGHHRRTLQQPADLRRDRRCLVGCDLQPAGACRETSETAEVSAS